MALVKVGRWPQLRLLREYGEAAWHLPPSSPDTFRYSNAVTPAILDSIGRKLCRSGESLFMIDVRQGKVSLTPCAQWTVHGNDDPASWLYRATLSGPDSTRMITLPAASVIHCRYSPHPSRPWAGRSPLTLALDTFRVAASLETATAGELSFSQKQVLSPRRNPGDYAPVDTLGPETIQKIVDAFSKHVSSDAFVIPADVQATRLGPEPPDSFALLRDRFEQSIYSSCAEFHRRCSHHKELGPP